MIINAHNLVQSLGMELKYDRNNINERDKKLCMTLTNSNPYYFIIGATNLMTRKTIYIQVDYNCLPIRCRKVSL